MRRLIFISIILWSWITFLSVISNSKDDLPDLKVVSISWNAYHQIQIILINDSSQGLEAVPDPVCEVIITENENRNYFDIHPDMLKDEKGGIQNPFGTSIFVIDAKIKKKAMVEVIIDPKNIIKESDITNNKLSQSLEAAVPPVLPAPVAEKNVTKPETSMIAATSEKSGIEISDINIDSTTDTTVTITWKANIETTGKVFYDTKVGGFKNSEPDSNVSKDHAVKIGNLNPGTAYQFKVVAYDLSRNYQASRAMVFTTYEAKEAQKASFELTVPPEIYGDAAISINSKEISNIDRVVYIVDDRPVFTDYSQPFTHQLDTSNLSDGTHAVSVRVYDRSGNEMQDVRDTIVANNVTRAASPVHVSIISPERESEVYDIVHIGARITNRENHKIARVVTRVDDRIVIDNRLEPPVSLILFLDRALYETINLETFGYSTGPHTIRVEATDEVGNVNYDAITIHVIPVPPASISVTRNVRRIGNSFEVELAVSNTGAMFAGNVVITDNNVGYQCASGATMRTRDAAEGNVPTTYQNTSGNWYNSAISFQIGSLASHESRTLKYFAIPILPDPWDTAFYPIIGARLVIDFSSNGTHTTQTLHNGWINNTEYDAACREADYLLVTCPEKISQNNSSRNFRLLFAGMAEMAKEERGVLGYINLNRFNAGASEVKNLIASGGAWSSRLSNGYASHGYLLFVGENDIVPAFTLSTEMHRNHNGGFIRLSDQPYCDTVDSDNLPDLIVGRIIGNDSDKLLVPINNYIALRKGLPGHEFTPTQALCVSGPEGTWELFMRNIRWAGDQIRAKGIQVSYQDWEYYAKKNELLAEALVIGWPNDYSPERGGPHTCPVELDLVTLIYEMMSRLGVTVPVADIMTYENRATTEAIRIEKNRTGEGDYGNYTIAAEGENPEVLRSDGYKALTPGKGIIFFNGHGDHGGWCGGVTNWTGALRTVQGTSFGSQHPFILAVSCNTGNYNTPSTAELADGIAETYLQLGAGVYIGSPEVLTADDHGSTYGQRFFRDYWRANTSIGEMFRNLERALYATGDAVWIYYVNNMNIYGDPKLGGR